MNTKELLLRMLITKGSIITKEGYYGDNTDCDATQAAQLDVDKYFKSINLNKTESPADSIDRKFNGTFNEESDCYAVVTCEIKRKGFKEPVLWKMEAESVDGLCGIVNYCADLFEQLNKDS